MKFDLAEREVDILEQTKDICRYEVLDANINNNDYMLDVLDYDDTVELLSKYPKSFCRFGDGEIELIEGRKIPFQKYDKRLADMLLEILTTNNDNCYVGINYNYFHSTDKLNRLNKKFYLTQVKKYREFLLKYCNRRRKYIAAGFNQLYAFYEHYDYKTYYKKLKELFMGREIVIFAGDGILDKLTYDVFELAKSKEFIYGPNKNAFDKFDELLEQAASIPPSKTIVLILGPCSKVLAWELSKRGFIAWDVGHLAKDYDMYMKRVEKSEENIIDFYRPD